MHIYRNETKELFESEILDINVCNLAKLNKVYFFKFTENEKLDKQLIYLIENIDSNLEFGIEIKNETQLSFILNHSFFEKIKLYLINDELLSHKDIHFLFLINKNLCINRVNNKIRNSDFKNPIISHILSNSSIENNYEGEEIQNTFNFDVNKYCQYIKNYNYKELVLENIRKVWGHYSSYYIFNLNKELTNNQIEDIYNHLSSNLGKIIECRPVNSNIIKKSYTRDVKFIPNSNHFYSSNIMQPLHSDFAYFTYEKAPDFLTLFCFQKSEYGGITSLITTEKVKKIMKKYNPDLYSRVIDLDFTYTSQVDEEGNFEVHEKKFFDENTNYINWNYYQIKEKYNDTNKMNLREEIFKFFYEIISKGLMYDLNINWERGDCILFNDHLNLHTRTAFLGERWLSGNAFFKK